MIIIPDENYGSTGQHILNERLSQYNKYVEKLRKKLPPDEKPHGTVTSDSQNASVTTEGQDGVLYSAKDVTDEPEMTQTHAVVHNQTKPTVTSLDEPDFGHVVSENHNEASRYVLIYGI